jgi:Putative MetA-pathway of phenol degradation
MARGRASGLSFGWGSLAALVVFVAPFYLLAPAMAADNCPGSSSEIATDRPDVTNSSLVVPVGSLQSENGVDLISGGGARALDGTNTRLRVGVSPCVEFLVDLPSYSVGVQGPADWGFSNLSPAVKWQISPLPGKFDLSVTAGVGLPTGASRIAGPGAQPYLQFPWSLELSDDWAVNGMVTEFFKPSDPANRLVSQYTFVLERKFGRQTDLFVEYVANVGWAASTSQLINSGLAYRVTPTQQVDFHVAFGLDRSTPSWIVGVGYSFRLDHLFSANK